MEHTKGEWEVSLERGEITGDYFITADNDLTILATVHKLASMENSTFRHEAKANAQLIAAAPDLLAACENYGNHLVDCATNASEVADEFAAMGCTCGLEDIIAKAKE